MGKEKIELDGETLTIEQVISVARNGTQVTLSPKAKTKVEAAAKLIQQWTDSGEVIYGVTTGFGPFSEVVISSDKAREIQRNLLISHAAGVGSPLPIEVVRATILLRANTLAKGFSGIQLSTLQLLLDLLNKRVHPVIPGKGSVGASGDLAPLSHMALVLIGEGEAEFHGEILPGAEALERAKLTPITLDRKEGIALINGTQVMTGIAALAIADAKALAASAEIAAALSIEALEGVSDGFDHRIQEARPHAGQKRTAQNLRALLKGSDLVLTSRQRAQNIQDALKEVGKIRHSDDATTHDALDIIIHHVMHLIIELDVQIAVESGSARTSLEQKRDAIMTALENLGVSQKAIDAAKILAKKTIRVQDAYSLRCTPQVIGAVRDNLDYIYNVVSIEINSATDNPLIFPDSKIHLSGGNFHGQPIALAMDMLSTAVTSIGTIAERRMARLIDHHLSNGLPLLLLKPTMENRGVYYGLGLAQISAAALVAECRTLSTPASIQTIPTSANQEDHVSMGTISARHARDIIENVEHIIAFELLCAAQGIDLRKLQREITLGQGSDLAYQIVRKTVPSISTYHGEKRHRVTQDTFIHQDVIALSQIVHNKQLLDAVINRVPEFSF
ncbi:MAG: HAL/PAL/TAL family ammonia-lyase [Candidatus Hermodarchaeia archaeon]|jgi:histidine ammonia-lyase